MQVKKAIEAFSFDGELIEYEKFGKGHINDTYAVYYKREFQRPIRYILQKVNTNIFIKPHELMENIERVTTHLTKKVENPQREALSLVYTKNGKSFFEEEGCFWRAYHFIDDATCYQSATPALFYESAVGFGKFQRLLNDFDASKLHETITDFHNTVKRYENFEKALKENAKDRAKYVKPEIEFITQRKHLSGAIVNMLNNGIIPLRVTHNDTKLNNIMIDNKTQKALCVIDLDTIMPGSVLYDFGDSIRFGASTGAEDEVDLSKVNFDLSLFESFTKGYLSEASDVLTQKEIDHLYLGAIVMTFECGIRFLTDYLQGDTYFKIHKENHNLDRARTQLKLIADMEKTVDAMNEIVAKCSTMYKQNK